MTTLTAATRLVALLGHPVAHSISPQIHNAAFAAGGVDAVYVALDVEPEAVATAVAGLAAVRFLGANVTVPHKRSVWLEVPRRTQDAERSGAANTLFWDDGVLAVDNTDVAALRKVLTDECGLTGGEPVLLLGAGGAARAVALAAGELQLRLEVVGRRAEAVRQIEQVAEAAGAAAQPVADPVVLVNATPLGLAGEQVPDRFRDVGPGQTALDLVYGPAETPFLAAAGRAGAAAVDGLSMLIWQAAAAFERWTGQSAPVDVMRSAAAAALQHGAQPRGGTGR